MGKINQLKSGVILSYINLALGSIIPFVYTPIMLGILGQAEYGLYSLSNSVIGYLSLLNFGLGSTIVRYISKYRAENNKEMEEKVIGLFIVLYSVLALLVMICGFFIYNNITLIFGNSLSIDEISKMKILVLIMSFNTAISFPISVFSSITIAHEKYIFRKLVDMFSTVIVPIFNIIVLYLGFGSVGMSLISTFMQFLLLPIDIIYCFKILRIKPCIINLPFNLLKELISFSFYVFLASIVDMLFWATDKVLLGAMVSTTAVAVYNIGTTFNNMFQQIATSISGVLTPRLTSMVVKNVNTNEYTDYLVKVGRLQFMVVMLILTGFIVFGKKFIELWAGSDYVYAYYIALFTMIPLSVPLIQSVAKSIVIAMNKHKFRSICYLIIAVLNVISTYLVIPYLGGLGAAICSGISYIIGQGIIMNIYYYKVIKLNIIKFWQNILKMSIPPILLCLSFIFFSQFIIINNLLTFLIYVGIYTILYIFIMYLFSMNKYEKEILFGFISRIVRR